MAVALHVVSDDGAVEDVEGGEQRGCRDVCSHGSWCRRGPTSSAVLAGCDRALEFGSHGDLWVKMFRLRFRGKSPVVARVSKV